MKTDDADKIFEIFRDNIQWNTGIQTRYGNTTRMQASLFDCSPLITRFLIDLSTKIFKVLNISANLESVYLNYYRDGNDYCPNHRHTDTKQLVISLGGSRIIKISNINYLVQSGSLVIFGHEYHSVDKQPNANPRISIALFYK